MKLFIYGERERDMIVSFQKIVERFISEYGIRTVVLKTEYVEENRCRIYLKGGYTIRLEVFKNVLYKDAKSYCKVEELFN